MEVVIKHALISKKVDNKGAKLQNARIVVRWLTWKMSNDGKNILFIEIPADELDRSKSYGCKTVKKTILYTTTYVHFYWRSFSSAKITSK